LTCLLRIADRLLHQQPSSVHASHFLQGCSGLGRGIDTRLHQPHFRWTLGYKINSQYYRNVLLANELLPAICNMAGNVFAVQRDNARPAFVTQTRFRAPRHLSISTLTCRQ